MVSFLEVVLLASDEETGDVVIVFGANEALEVGVIFFDCQDFILRQLLLQIMQFLCFLKMFPLGKVCFRPALFQNIKKRIFADSPYCFGCSFGVDCEYSQVENGWLFMIVHGSITTM